MNAVRVDEEREAAPAGAMRAGAVAAEPVGPTQTGRVAAEPAGGGRADEAAAQPVGAARAGAVTAEPAGAGRQRLGGAGNNRSRAGTVTAEPFGPTRAGGVAAEPAGTARARRGGSRAGAAGAVRGWRDADPYAEALRAGQGPLFLRRGDGWLLPLDVERWCAAPDLADATVLERCRGSVLDVGCGPGRLVAAVAALGRPALGVDVSREAVDRTIRAGGAALCRSVFDPLPDEGRWGTVLLIDGNIGIGGDPVALLRRVAELARPDGRVIVETDPHEVDERVDVQVDDGRGGKSARFPWARVGQGALLPHAAAAGWRPVAQWRSAGRPFTQLVRGTALWPACPAP